MQATSSTRATEREKHNGNGDGRGFEKQSLVDALEQQLRDRHETKFDVDSRLREVVRRDMTFRETGETFFERSAGQSRAGRQQQIGSRRQVHPARSGSRVRILRERIADVV